MRVRTLCVPAVLVVTTLVAACAPSKPRAADPDVPAAVVDAATASLLGKVVAERRDLDLAAPGADPSEILWNEFANQPYEQQFSGITTEDWFVKSQAFRARLIERASTGRLDAAALARAIDALGVAATDEVATVPVGAFAVRHGAEPVWIVVAKWEEAEPITDAATGRREWAGLGHIHIVAVRTSDGNVVASSRCK